MKIATWNVNSIRVRLPHVIDFIKKQSPDVLLLQELKAQDQDIPKSDLEDTGYNVIFKGQKAYNGVAILSKHPVSDIVSSLYDSDEQARYLECWVDAKNSGFRVASIYLPNGNPINTEKFEYKIEWMTKLKQHVKKLLDNEESIILGGDFNVCPEDMAVAINAIKESPAPVTSKGFTDNAGNDCLLILPSISRSYATNPSEPSFIIKLSQFVSFKILLLTCSRPLSLSWSAILASLSLGQSKLKFLNLRTEPT